jgi:hypothetical protein
MPPGKGAERLLFDSPGWFQARLEKPRALAEDGQPIPLQSLRPPSPGRCFAGLASPPQEQIKRRFARRAQRQNTRESLSLRAPGPPSRSSQGCSVSVRCRWKCERTRVRGQEAGASRAPLCRRAFPTFWLVQQTCRRPLLAGATDKSPSKPPVPARGNTHEGRAGMGGFDVVPGNPPCSGSNLKKLESDWRQLDAILLG